MKVSKDSWHYKLMSYFNFKITHELHCGYNVTLCSYFWNVVGCLLWAVFYGAFVITCAALAMFVVAVVIFGFVIAPVSYLTQSYFGFGWDRASNVGMVMIWLGWVFLPLCIGVEAVIKGDMKVVPEWLKLKSSSAVKDRPKTKPNLLLEFIKAKKNKFCPIIKLED